MIRINLLPVRAEKKKESIRQQISIGLLLIFFVVIVMVFLQLSLSRSISSIQAELSNVESEIGKYKQLLKEVSEYKGQKKVMEEKIKVIEQLEKNRQGPLLLLEEMSSSIPDSAWLEKMQEKGKFIEITGFAVDNETIADFMERLEDAKGFERVELIVTSRVDKVGMNLKNFTITFSIKTPTGG